MSPYSASPCPCPSPSPAHCLLLLCATSAYSKLYNECVTIKPVPVQAKFKCHCYFRATKICRPFASSGLVETEETDSEDPARLPGDTLYRLVDVFAHVTPPRAAAARSAWQVSLSLCLCPSSTWFDLGSWCCCCSSSSRT